MDHDGTHHLDDHAVCDWSELELDHLPATPPRRSGQRYTSDGATWEPCLPGGRVVSGRRARR